MKQKMMQTFFIIICLGLFLFFSGCPDTGDKTTTTAAEESTTTTTTTTIDDSQKMSLVGTVTNWKETDENNLMVISSDGKYEKTIFLEAGDYEFKFIIDMSWVGALAGVNATCELGIEYDLVQKDMGGTALTVTEEGNYKFSVDYDNSTYIVIKDQ